MGRRRNSAPTSSLDLFLDTICNAFGGIMFLSILISILLQMKTDSSEPSEQPRQSVEEINAVQSSIARLESEKAKLLASISELEERIASSAKNNQQVLPKLSEMEAIKSRLALLEDQKSKITQQILDEAKSSTLMKSQLEALQNELTGLDEEAREKRLALEKALDAKEKTMALPQAKGTTKGNVLLAIRYEKLYLISDPATVHRPTQGFYGKHVLAKKLLGITHLSPIPSAGWPIQNDEFRSQLSQSLATVSKDDYFLSVAVWQDSYEQFEKFKTFAIENGFEYDLLPLGNPDSIILGSGGNAVVQ